MLVAKATTGLPFESRATRTYAVDTGMDYIYTIVWYWYLVLVETLLKEYSNNKDRLNNPPISELTVIKYIWYVYAKHCSIWNNTIPFEVHWLEAIHVTCNYIMYDLLRQLETNPMQKFIKGVKFVTGGWYLKFSVKAKMSFLSYKCPEHLNKINGFNFKALHQQWWHPHTRKAKNITTN